MRRLLVLAAALSLAACAHKKKAPPPPAPLPVEQPLIAYEAVKVEGMEFKGANLLFRARIENPNPFPLSVKRVDYSLQIEGRPAASGAMETALLVPAAVPATADPAAAAAPAADPAVTSAAVRGKGEIALPVRVGFSSIPGVAKVLAMDREAAYALGGSVTFSTPPGDVKVPFSLSGTLPMPKLPHVRVEKASLRRVSSLEIAVLFLLSVQNPNAFAIPPGRIGYALLLSDREVARADLEVPAPIEGGTSASLVAPLKISPMKAGKAAARLLIPFSSLDVKVKGEAVFGGVPVPLDLGASLTQAQ